MNQIDLIDFTDAKLAHALMAVQTGGYATALPELSLREKALIYHYTDIGSQALNLPLHQLGGANTTPFGQGLAAALTLLPPFAGLVYSAALLDEPQLLELMLKAASGGTAFGLDVVHWPAFLSASRSQAEARQHLNYGPKNCLFFISSRTGRHIEALSHYGPNNPARHNEREVLFLPNTRFEVVAVRMATSFPEIELLELPPI